MSTSEVASDEFADSLSRRTDTLTIREPRRPYELTCLVLVRSISLIGQGGWNVCIRKKNRLLLIFCYWGGMC